MVGKRVKELRKEWGLSQQALAMRLGVMQQMISRIETGNGMTSDVLIGLAKYFNVTADYILELSDSRMSANCQIRLEEKISQYYDMVQRYENLSPYNQEVIDGLLEHLEHLQAEDVKSKNGKIVEYKFTEDNSYVADSNL